MMTNLLYALHPDIRLNVPTPSMGTSTGSLFLQTTVILFMFGIKYIHSLVS
jgi:hypothetical protein